jgi:hypothetical protein
VEQSLVSIEPAFPKFVEPGLYYEAKVAEGKLLQEAAKAGIKFTEKELIVLYILFIDTCQTTRDNG